jgi:dCTP deaminase
MSILPDIEILARGEELLKPFDPKNVQPGSYDLTLANEILIPVSRLYGAFDVNILELPYIDLQSYDSKKYTVPSYLMLDTTSSNHCHEHVSEGYVLLPGRCLLGSTVERVTIPNNLAARVEGKSTLGRVFLVTHCTAGFIDPGFDGQITLEIVNLGPWRILLRPGMKIAQINFTQLTQPCARPYGSPGLGSHYQGQQGPVAAHQKGPSGWCKCPGCAACTDRPTCWRMPYTGILCQECIVARSKSQL